MYPYGHRICSPARMERDRELDLLEPADPAAEDEVADRLRLGRRERPRTVVRLGRLRARRAVTAREVVAVVAVEVRADARRAAVRLAVLAPLAVRVPGQVVLGAVGVDRRDDPDLVAVDDVRDPRVRTVSVGEPAQDRQALLEREVLASVVQRIEQDLRFGLVGSDVVGDLDDVDIATLVRGPDRADLHDVGVGRLGVHEDLDHLGVTVVAGILGREVRGRGGRGRGGRGADRQEQGDRRDEGQASASSRHGGQGRTVDPPRPVPRTG